MFGAYLFKTLISITERVSLEHNLSLCLQKPHDIHTLVTELLQEFTEHDLGLMNSEGSNDIPPDTWVWAAFEDFFRNFGSFNSNRHNDGYWQVWLKAKNDQILFEAGGYNHLVCMVSLYTQLKDALWNNVGDLVI